MGEEKNNLKQIQAGPDDKQTDIDTQKIQQLKYGNLYGPICFIKHCLRVNFNMK